MPDEKIKDAMSLDELKAAGVRVDLPTEAPTSAPLRYTDGSSLTDKFPHLLDPDLKRDAE